MDEEPACSYNTESSLDAARAVKQEINIGPTVLQPTDLHYMMMEPIKVEPLQMEEDPSCSYNTESSLDAARAVKQEIDIGPTVLQPTDLHYMMMEPKLETSNEDTTQCRREDSRHNHFVDKDALLEYKKKTRIKSELKCGVCQKCFTQKYNLKNHVILSHKVQRDYCCEICQKFFARKETLKRHMTTHTVQKDHCCEICHQFFNRIRHLKRHMTTHTGQRDYCCEICQKFFARKETLKQHMTSHTGKKDYCCEICQKSFARKEHLKQHMTLHMGKKDYCCEICQKVYARKETLKRHMTTHTR